MFQHILVPTDGTPLSLRNVAHAASYAKETGARVTVFCAQSEPPLAYAGLGAVSGTHLTQDIQTRLNEAASDTLEAAEALVRDAGTTCQRLVRVGNRLYELIIQAAQFPRLRPDLHGLARAARRQRAAAGQRDPEGADARHGSGAGLPVRGRACGLCGWRRPAFALAGHTG